MSQAEVSSGLMPGHSAPDFEMDTYDPNEMFFGKVSLEQLRKDGKWTVLFFYPADFTFVWATEFSALAEQYDKFKELGAEVVTVSTDTQFVHMAWKQNEKSLEKVKFQMAADPTGNVSRAYGVYDASTGLDLRGTFIISPDGVVLNSEVNFYNVGRNIDELLRKVKANIYLAKHGTEVCPAQWQDEGDKTLKPGPELVGKVYEALE